jgi:hypothetical protein
MAIITPTIGAAYLIWQIHKRNLRGWQHYACVTALFFLISILFLVGSGRVESFGLAGNTVKVVDQKLEEIRTLTERNKLMAKGTVELVTRATSGLMADESYDSRVTHQSAVELLKSAGFSDSEVQKFFDALSRSSARTNSP